jgi:hypothetical protein
MAFAGIPSIPTSGLADWQSLVFSAIKENVELLTGTRGGAGGNHAAIIRGNITVLNLNTQNMRQVTAQGKGWTGLSGLPTGEGAADMVDFQKLVADVQSLANDLVETRDVLNVLLTQLKG